MSVATFISKYVQEHHQKTSDEITDFVTFTNKYLKEHPQATYEEVCEKFIKKQGKQAMNIRLLGR